MRTFTLLAAAAAAGISASPGKADTRTFGITSFDRIRVEGPFNVRLKTGVAPVATATGSAAALDRVDVEVEGSTLVVRPSLSGWGGFPGQSTGPVEISLGTHELSSAVLNGSGKLDIDRAQGLSFNIAVQGSGAVTIARTDVDQLRVSIAGTGTARLAGNAGKLVAAVRGISALEGPDLITKDATIGAEGPASVKLTVTNSASVEAAGAATVSLAGTPACTAKLSGSATLSGCRASQ